MDVEDRIGKIKDLINRSANVVITIHHSPDGDAIGSALGLYHYLYRLGCHPKVISPNDYPACYHWLNGHEDVLFHNVDPVICEKRVMDADIIFCLDFNSLDRLYDLELPVRNSKAKRILIDHHPGPQDTFDVVISDPDSSSTAALIYEFIVAMGDEPLLNQPVCEALYTGILTDTGCFRYASTNEQALRICAALIGHGADHGKICSAVYDNNSENRLGLLGYCLSEKMLVLRKYNTVLISLSLAELDRFHYEVGDTEDIVNYGLTIKGIRMSALITEREDEIKISLRSKGKLAVNEIAGKHFSGGGHRNAAGGQTNLSLDETIEKFLSVLPEYENELTS